MKTLREYLDEKEEENLNESFAGTVGTILGYATDGLIAAFGGALLILGAATSIKGIQAIWLKTKEVWKSDPRTLFKRAKKDKLVKQQLKKSEENKKKFADVLGKVYAAIDKKDFDKAKEEYSKLSVQYKLMPAIKQTIINEITSVLKEPPIWPPSPGNDTYKAIRTVLGLPEAKAAATAVKYYATKNITETPSIEEGDEEF